MDIGWTQRRRLGCRTRVEDLTAPRAWTCSRDANVAWGCMFLTRLLPTSLSRVATFPTLGEAASVITAVAVFNISIWTAAIDVLIPACQVTVEAAAGFVILDLGHGQADGCRTKSQHDDKISRWQTSASKGTMLTPGKAGPPSGPLHDPQQFQADRAENSGGFSLQGGNEV